MTANDLGHGSARQWSRPVLIVSAFLALALFAATAMGGGSLIAAGIAAILVLGLGAYLTAPRSETPPIAVAQAPANTPDALPRFARQILGEINDPIIVLDHTGRIVLANRASQSLVGAEAERKHISAVLRNPELLEGVERVLAGGPSESIAFTFLVPVERHYQAHVVSTKNDDADSAMVLIQLHDLTATRRAEELRTDFVANASHELRTPLAAVSGFIDTLRGHAKNDSEARERFLDIMSVETDRMRRLIEDLLSLTRIELNEHNPPSQQIDLVKVVRDAASALAPLAEIDGVVLEIEDGAPLPAIGDRDELIQVFQNLIHNAIKYGRERSTVRVHFGRTPGQGRRDALGQVFAAVEDDGEGIPREAVPRLTERFYRVDVKRSRERGSTGLGLAIVKHILNRHRGRLHIESTLGKGSTFTVSLPAA